MITKMQNSVFMKYKRKRVHGVMQNIKVAVVLVTQMNGLMHSIDMNDKEY